LETLSMAVNLMNIFSENDILRYWDLLDGLIQDEKDVEQQISINLKYLMDTNYVSA